MIACVTEILSDTLAGKAIAIRLGDKVGEFCTPPLRAFVRAANRDGLEKILEVIVEEDRYILQLIFERFGDMYIIQNVETGMFLKGFKGEASLWASEESEAAKYSKDDAEDLQGRLCQQIVIKEKIE